MPLFQVVFMAQAGRAHVDAHHAGARIKVGIAGRRHGAAAGHEDVEVIAIGLSRPIGPVEVFQVFVARLRGLKRLCHHVEERFGVAPFFILRGYGIAESVLHGRALFGVVYSMPSAGTSRPNSRVLYCIRNVRF